MLFKHLTRCHPEYDAARWCDYEKLYKGGDELLCDAEVMRRIFPPHGHEDAGVYQERLRRASYLPYAGAIIDYVVASVFAEPVAVTATPPAPAFYADFHASVDGYALDLTALLRQQLLTALLTRRAWTLVDLPPRDDGAVVESESDEQDLGLLRALAFPLDPASVLDWDANPSGDLEWALVRTRATPRRTLADDRQTVTDRFTHYTRDAWTRWDVTYRADKPPQPNQEVAAAAAGGHSFGRVPLLRLELSEGLWAMNKLAPLARQHLNKRSATDWSQYRHLFPILTAFLGPEMGAGNEIPSVAGSDPDRAVNQVYGIGRLVQYGDKDRLEYVSPDAAIYDAALKDLADLRDEMHRVLHQMALAVDNSAAALKRSGDSKAQDKAAAAVVMGALGQLARKHAVDLFATVAAGRRDPAMAFVAHGAEGFDGADPGQGPEETKAVQDLAIPSPTFRRLHTFAVAKRLVRGLATPAQVDAIRGELEKNITDASVLPPPAHAPAPAGKDAGPMPMRRGGPKTNGADA